MDSVWIVEKVWPHQSILSVHETLESAKASLETNEGIDFDEMDADGMIYCGRPDTGRYRSEKYAISQHDVRR